MAAYGGRLDRANEVASRLRKIFADRAKWSNQWRDKWEPVLRRERVEDGEFANHSQACDEKLRCDDPWESDRFSTFYNTDGSTVSAAEPAKKGKNKRKKRKKKAPTTASDNKLAPTKELPEEEREDEDEKRERLEMEQLLLKYKNVDGKVREEAKMVRRRKD